MSAAKANEPTIATFTASDGYVWRYRLYAGLGRSRAHVVCIHGIQSHGGWYTQSCASFSQAGFTVSFLDRRGSGLNEQDRGDAPSFRRLLDDLAEYLRPLRAANEQVFLKAISWGGKLATALQRRHPGLIDGLVLVCPGFYPRVRVALAERWRILWSRLVAPRRCFPIPLNDPELFTVSPQWHRFIATDPLSLRQATARLLVESARLDAYLRFVPKHVQVPVLLLLAEHDRIIDNGRTRSFVEQFASRDKNIIEYAGAHHTLEFEPDPRPYLADTASWLENHLG